jgi:hypothetical protein
MYAHVCIYVCACVVCVHTLSHTYTHTWILDKLGACARGLQPRCLVPSVRRWSCLCVYACVFVCVSARIHTHTHTHTHAHTHYVRACPHLHTTPPIPPPHYPHPAPAQSLPQRPPLTKKKNHISSSSNTRKRPESAVRSLNPKP